jgi:hypothetical protein
MAKKEFRNYKEAVKNLGPTMSREEFFDHGWPGFDDEPRLSLPKELKTEDGVLLYRMDFNELTIYGYEYNPFFGKTKIRLLQGFEKAKAGLEVMNGIGLEIDSPVKLSFW